MAESGDPSEEKMLGVHLGVSVPQSIPQPSRVAPGARKDAIIVLYNYSKEMHCNKEQVWC